MSDNPYTPPSAELAPAENPFPSAVKRPWVVYFMAFWLFFGPMSSANSMMRLYLGDAVQATLAPLVLLIVWVVLTVHILQMRRSGLIVFGVLAGLFAVLQIFNLLGLYQEGRLGLWVLLIICAFYLLPGIFMAYTVFKPGFLAKAAQFRAYRIFLAKEKAIMKSMRRK